MSVIGKPTVTIAIQNLPYTIVSILCYATIVVIVK
jgi:hypothetical protein